MHGYNGVAMRKLLASIVGLFRGYGTHQMPMANSGFQFTVEEVFYVKPPVDRVILVGTVQEGTVRMGDAAVFHSRDGPIDVDIESIDSIRQGTVNEATAGSQVGLKVRGLTQEQPARGNRVVGKEP